MKAYCVKCKESRELKDAKETVAKNGRRMLKGVCPNCSTSMFRFISDKDAKKGKM